MKIMHIAYGHRTDDTRILKKECMSLAASGHDVIYVTSDKATKSTTDIDNIRRLIIPLKSGGVFKRLYIFMNDIKKIVDKEKPDVCHIHDIQIIFLTRILSKKSKCIFDSHEDYPGYLADTLLKPINYRVKYLFVRFIEKICFKKCVLVIAATPYIRDQIKQFFENVIDITNYPQIQETPDKGDRNPYQICFTGGASDPSGLINVAKAIKGTNYKLIIAGNCSSNYLERMMEIAEENITYLGYLEKKEVERVIESSIVGVVTYLPTVNCLHSVPNKMFEYMERGTPIIYSNFSDWKELLDKHAVGISVDPKSPDDIRNALDKIQSDYSYRNTLSINSRKAVEELFNWDKEEKKLLHAYRMLELG